MTTENPLNELLELTDVNPAIIQEKYHLHRTNRNAQQKARLLSPEFKGFSIDEILAKLEDESEYPNFIDPRNCFVLWGRPTNHVKNLAATIQQRLSAEFPNMWLMPVENMHITLAEIMHSRTEPDIEEAVAKVADSLPRIANFTDNHRARLIKPALGYDASAIALSYLPAAGEVLSDGRTEQDDKYTYHHLRRDVFDLCDEAGIPVQGRYVHLSAHLTIARFIDEKDFRHEGEQQLDSKRVKKLVNVIESINEWLEKGFWPDEGDKIKEGGEWVVGKDKGLVARKGRLWYGGGMSIYEGLGF